MIQHYRQKNYCALLISLDIDSAFDSAKWHHILNALKQNDCPRPTDLPQILQQQTVIAEHKRTDVIDRTQGAPRLTLRTIFWNLLYNAILRLPFETDVQIISFADDCRLLVCGATEIATARRNKITQTDH